MTIRTLSTITALLVLFPAEINALHKDKGSLPALPTVPSLRHPKKTNPADRDLYISKTSSVKKQAQDYTFGAMAAASLEDAIVLGFLKNEHPFRYGIPLINLEVGHCVIVPRSDQSFSYGFVTEVMNPKMVCVACDNKSRTNGGYTIKIIATNQLFLRPEWLNHNHKDGSSLVRYSHAMQNANPIPETLQDEDSYERLPGLLAQKTK